MSGPNPIADTSIWIDHINGRDDLLVKLLRQRRLLAYLMVIGEIALGPLRDRRRALAELGQLSPAPLASHESVMDLIETSGLYSRGMGLVDAHLLASVLLVPHGVLWTRDKRLREAAERLSISADVA